MTFVHDKGDPQGFDPFIFGMVFGQPFIDHDLHLLDASVRHLGTDVNYIVLENIFNELKDRVDFHFNATVEHVRKTGDTYEIDVKEANGNKTYSGTTCIISAGRSGSSTRAKSG